MSSPPSPFGSPSPAEQHERLQEKKLAQKLIENLFVRERWGEEGVKHIQAIVAKEVNDENSKYVESWINQMKTKRELLMLNAQTMKKELRTNAQLAGQLKKQANEYFAVRDEVLNKVLSFIKSKKPPAACALNYMRSTTPLPSADEIDTIEMEVFSYTDHRNKAHKYGKPALPSFKEISEWREKIDLAKNNIDPNVSEADRQATLAYLQYIEDGISTVEMMDPVGKVTSISPMDNLTMYFKQYTPGILETSRQMGIMDASGNWNMEKLKALSATSNTPRDPIMMGGRAALLVLFSGLFISSAIITGKKLRPDGEDLELSDALTLAYGLGTLKLAGVDILPKKKSEQELVAKCANLYHDPQFQGIMKRMGKSEAIAAAEDLHDIMSTAKSRNQLKKLLKQGVPLDIAYFKEDGSARTSELYRDNLYDALNAKGISADDRRHFINELIKLNIGKEEWIEPIITAMKL